jgi:hypothetical protein
MQEVDYEAIIDEIQASEVKTKIRNRLFNQPNLITVSSVNRQQESDNYTPYSQTAFSSFNVSLPRPVLDVKSLQLLSTNIPMCNANIPNTACVFWYYRLSEYSGLTPNINNLFYVRLLPSFYKQELIYQPTQFGFNQTFGNYNALNTQLAKSCTTDLLYENYTTLQNDAPTNYTTGYVPYLPGDIAITYDTPSNKFKMTGQNTQAAYLNWDSLTLYDIGSVVALEAIGVRTKAYTAKQISVGLAPGTTPFAWVSGGYYEAYNYVSYAGNNYQSKVLQEESLTAPPEDPTNWAQVTGPIWKRTYTEIVQEWDGLTFYDVGLLVMYDGVLYKALAISLNEIPFENPTFWQILVDPPQNWYKYLITGYDDPNVQLLQGKLFNLEWNPYALYYPGQKITYQGRRMKARYLNRNSIPQIDMVNPTNLVWIFDTTYPARAYVFYGITVYESLSGSNVGNPPDTSPKFWKPLGLCSSEWSDTIPYAKGRFVVMFNEDDPSIFESLVDNNLNNDPRLEITWKPVGFFDAWEFTADAPLVTGLLGLTEKYDMVEFIENSALYVNFPFGIGGQPCNPNPKRLLNSILGFTWSGQFNPTDFKDTGETLPC